MRAPKRARGGQSVVPSFEECERILNSKSTSRFEREQLAGVLVQRAAERDGRVARRALVALYELQTGEERSEGKSKGVNGVGCYTQSSAHSDAALGMDARGMSKRGLTRRYLSFERATCKCQTSRNNSSSKAIPFSGKALVGASSKKNAQVV